MQGLKWRSIGVPTMQSEQNLPLGGGDSGKECLGKRPFETALYSSSPVVRVGHTQIHAHTAAADASAGAAGLHDHHAEAAAGESYWDVVLMPM